MRLVHHFSHSLVVAPFQGIAHVQNSLNFSYDIFCAHEILFTYVSADFFQPDSLAVAQALYFRMALLDGLCRSFA